MNYRVLSKEYKYSLGVFFVTEDEGDWSQDIWSLWNIFIGITEERNQNSFLSAASDWLINE